MITVSTQLQVRFGHRLRGFLVIIALLGGVGCSTLQAPQREHLVAADPGLAECAEWFRAVDAAVAQSAVGDIAARRVAGFPYLRIDRFLEANKVEARTDEMIRRAWVDEMRALGRSGRNVEITNLPQTQVDRLAGGDRQVLFARSQQCAKTLLAADRIDDRTPALLFQHATVDDDYSRLKRMVGLYALTRLPFYAGVSGWQKEVSKIFGPLSLDAAARSRIVRYRPPPERGYSDSEVTDILMRAAEHPLGMVSLSDQQRARLFATFAPVIEVETTGTFDRIGRVYWADDGRVQVDDSRPVVYRRLGYTRMDGRSLLQLVYTAWLPERPLNSHFDVLGGHLDGIVWRVTLAPDGKPLLFDSIHPCGCYHLFFPTPRLEPMPAPKRWIEWAFVPRELPVPDAAQTVTISLQSRTHYLLSVTVSDNREPGETYQFAEYDELRSLPLPGGGRRSLFGPDGLVAGSERGERFLFWPMGIASPGAMRQAGTQATAFVGRRHFDDADLLEKRFRLRD